ncbi:nuclear transcription factor y subunit b-3 [Phtheirospermum japonicum]|uniref:Nuclear transcription factor y subunit b-3 n=1 Tax=Phtheirospermum japonicum TaxID=374723 RepID=A0A830CYI9_9LAMI|nr:nuclear transcription factor y subunit b-3 [Phtheirospermum japonicum]
MKKALPANAKISKDAKETVQECVSEFISFVTGEASDKCLREKRKTINGDDLLWAMTTLGFEDYMEPLRVYLQRFRDVEGEKSAMAGGGGGGGRGEKVDTGGDGGVGMYGMNVHMMGHHQGGGEPVYGYGQMAGGNVGSDYHLGSGSGAVGGRPR